MDLPQNRGSHQSVTLMKRSTKYVGPDVHQATIVASVRKEGGPVFARTSLPTEAQAIEEFFQGMRGRVHVAFEEGSQAQGLHDLIAPIVARVTVCDLRGANIAGATRETRAIPTPCRTAY